MGVTWAERDEVDALVRALIVPTDVVLDVGPGIVPQRYVVPSVHICVEPHRPYLERLRMEHPEPRYVLLNSAWGESMRLLLDDSVDTVFALDFIEHLEKDAGRDFLAEAERVARRQIVVYTPLGFYRQDYHGPEAADRWGMDGGWWQTHRSGWELEDFAGWEIVVCSDWHTVDEFEQPLEVPCGALWGVKNLAAGPRDDRQVVAGSAEVPE